MTGGFVVNDKRGKKEPEEVCRVCGCEKVHSKEYNKPTMECIKYLRLKITDLEDHINSCLL